MRSRRKKTARVSKRPFLVLCEGETEEAYVELLKRHYRLPIAIKTKVSGNSLNDRLVKQYQNEIGEEDCSVFFMYDGDIESVVLKLLKMENLGAVIITTPCLEFWFLHLHIRHKKEIGYEMVIEALPEVQPI